MNAMDSYALTYLVQRFFYRIGEFVRHWYVKSVRMYWNWIMNQLQEIDYSLAWRITAKNLFQPLYKDYSVVGYVIGFTFRFLRLVLAGGLYLVLFAVALALYLAWLILPLYVVLRILIG